MAFVSDIQNQTTESKKDMLLSIIRSLTEGILAIGEEGTILYANSEAESILEISEDEMIGRKIRTGIGMTGMPVDCIGSGSGLFLLMRKIGKNI